LNDFAVSVHFFFKRNFFLHRTATAMLGFSSVLHSCSVLSCDSVTRSGDLATFWRLFQVGSAKKGDFQDFQASLDRFRLVTLAVSCPVAIQTLSEALGGPEKRGRK
jgi:hypothetical protein